MDFQLVQKQCKLTNIEIYKFENFAKNQNRYPNGITVKQLGINSKKIAGMVVNGYLKKSGICWINNGKQEVDLFKVV